MFAKPAVFRRSAHQGASVQHLCRVFLRVGGRRRHGEGRLCKHGDRENRVAAEQAVHVRRGVVQRRTEAPVEVGDVILP